MFGEKRPIFNSLSCLSHHVFILELLLKCPFQWMVKAVCKLDFTDLLVNNDRAKKLVFDRLCRFVHFVSFSIHAY